MKIIKPVLVIMSIILTVFSSCSPNLNLDVKETIVEVVDSGIQSLNIPDGFEFSTKQDITVIINDNASYAKYEVYAYADEKYLAGTETFENQEGEIVTEAVYKNDVLDNLVFTGIPKNGKLTQTISIPSYYDKLYIRRNDNLKYNGSIENIVDQKVDYTHRLDFAKSSNTKVDDFLYCVNGSAELFQVDPLTGDLTYLSDMPMGSWTAAIDQENKTLYSIGRSSPFPLMKYSIVNNTWETVANIGKGGPRLDYNYRDGLLYFSTGNKLFTYNPSNGANINTMTFDSNQELWLANNASSSDLIIMDTQTGGWQYNFGVSANNNSDLGKTINDLTTFRVFTELLVDPDTDGDGILDRDDTYPEDAEKAFEMFTPSKYGWGTVAFEDLWPSNGDYDLNDLAVNYRVVAVLNAQNLAVQLDFLINVTSIRAAFTNGFGIEIETLVPSQIKSVTGNILKHNYIVQNANGTETGQQNAVVIIFDDPYEMRNNETKISVKLTTPLSTNELGSAPFNPFLIIDKTREREVHLANMHTTSLGTKNFQINGVNRDEDGNYLNDNGLPWAINIVHDFKVPKEKISIIEAYNHFDKWAISGGGQYKDWYKDNPGYRNMTNIYN